MGWAKKLMMEIQDQGDWPELYGKCICSRHYEDNYLKELIDKDAFFVAVDAFESANGK